MSRACAIGIDVGGTKIAAGLVEPETGRLLNRHVIPTWPQRGGQAVLDDALALAQRLRSEAAALGYHVAGIGVGVCELVDPAGNITSSYTLDWAGRPVQAAFAELAPAVVDSDARAPALAEARYGAGQPFRTFCYVTVGTGISSCFVQEGRPHVGARGNAILLASSPLTTVCSHCGTVLQPVLETFAGGPGLVASYNAVTGQQFTRAEAVLAAAHDGDRDAVRIVRHAAQALGVAVGWLVNVLDPAAVIVGGGLGSVDGLYWECFVAAAREHIWSAETRALPILHAGLGPDAGIIGAAATITLRLEKGLHLIDNANKHRTIEAPKGYPASSDANLSASEDADSSMCGF